MTTNFGAKDALVSGNPLKLILGAQYTTEFNNIASAVNSKADGAVTFFPDGTVGQPSVGFASIVGTGMYNAAGVLNFATNSVQRISIATTGGVTVVAPTSGVALTVNGVANQWTHQVNGVSGAGTSFGLTISAGTTSADTSFRAGSFGGTTYLQVFGDGGVTVGSPTGGDLGIGTINAAGGFYVNGAAIGGAAAAGTLTGTTLAAGVVTSSLTTVGTLGALTVTGAVAAGSLTIGGVGVYAGAPASANTTAALSDIGKMINASGTITIPNSTFSQGHGLSIYNNSASAITITASITTMRLAGTATTGSRTLAARGIATIWFESGTECVVGGPGVT